MTSPVDNILVQLDKAYQDTITTASGFTLYKDTSLTPEWDVTVTGKVVAIPKRLSKNPDRRGLDIDPQLKEGDEIVFSYQVVDDKEVRENDTYIHHNLFYHKGEWYWKVDYIHYLGRVIEGKIVPAQGYVFCEPLEEEVKEEKIGLIWLPEMKKKEKPKGKAKVSGVGRKRDGFAYPNVKEGEVVRYSERYAWKYNIKDKNYIVLPFNLVLATEEN